MQAQMEGRSLLPLLTAKVGQQVSWPDRTLFTHVGRWNGADPEVGRYANASVRTARWHLVVAGNGQAAGKGKAKGGAQAGPGVSAPAKPSWQLFDLSADYGETTDIAAQHPEVVVELAAKYETWWKEVRPMMVNEGVKGPAENSFKVLYREQMGK
jgi:arylsulfatase